MDIRPFTLLLLAVIAPFLVLAETAADIELSMPKVMRLSYVSHPAVDNFFIPLIQKSYERLGVETHFISVEAERGYLLLEDGLVDGDVIRSKMAIDTVKTLVPVVLLDEVSAELHCRPEIHCTLEDLNNENITIFFPETVRGLKALGLSIKAKTYHLRDWTQLIQLYKANRVDRFLWLSSALSCDRLMINTKVIPLSAAPIRFYHVVHESKSHITEKLKVAIQHELLAIKQTSCH